MQPNLSRPVAGAPTVDKEGDPPMPYPPGGSSLAERPCPPTEASEHRSCSFLPCPGASRLSSTSTSVPCEYMAPRLAWVVPLLSTKACLLHSPRRWFSPLGLAVHCSPLSSFPFPRECPTLQGVGAGNAPLSRCHTVVLFSPIPEKIFEVELNRPSLCFGFHTSILPFLVLVLFC